MSNLKLVSAAEAFAGAAETLIEKATEIVRLVPDFPDSVAEQDEADIRKGLTNRSISKTPTQLFLKDGDSYAKISAADAKKADPAKVAVIDAEQVMALSPHELGQLKTTEPNRHAIVSKIRKGIQTNVSNRYADLVRIAKQIKGSAGRTASAKKGLLERMKVSLANIDKMFNTARTRGNPEAVPAEIVRSAELAYLAKIETYLKGKK